MSSSINAEVIQIPQQPVVSQSLMKPIASPKDLIQYHDDMAKIIQQALKVNTDYGSIPGTKGGPVLLKPGAERICIAFGCHPEYDLVEKEADHDRENKHKYGTSTGLYRYVYKCRIVRNSDSSIIGEAQGVCSTMEAKYISRPRDCENTACKMAQKRAFVAATLHAFGLSDRFTQDLEDAQEENNTSPEKDIKSKSTKTESKSKTKVFDPSSNEMVDELLKKLIAKGTPDDLHDDIAKNLSGKEWTKEAFQKAIDEVTLEKIPF